MPEAGARRESVGVDACQLSVREQPLAGHPRVADLIAPGHVDQMRDRVVARRVRDASEVDRDHVGLLSGS